MKRKQAISGVSYWNRKHIAEKRNGLIIWNNELQWRTEGPENGFSGVLIKNYLIGQRQAMMAHLDSDLKIIRYLSQISSATE